MAVKASEIINYTGNANLGLGASNAIPVSSTKDFEAVNRASELMRQYDHEDKVTIFKQKVADRDKLLQLLMDEQVPAGGILDADKKYYDEAEKYQTESYKKIKGLNDPEGIRNNLKATKDLKDITVWAQHKKLEIDKLRAEQASMTLPQDREAMEQHIQKQLAKKPGEFVDPYQKAFSTDIDGMKTAIIGSQMLTKGAGGSLSEKTAQTKTVTTTGKDGKITTKEVIQTKPVPGTTPTTKKTAATTGTVVNEDGSLSAFSETPEKYFDYPAMERRASELYYNDPVQAENQRQFVNTFNRMPLPAQVDFVKANQARLFDYYHQRGIEPDENGKFPNDFNYVVLEPVKDANGKIVDYKPKYITENVPASSPNSVLPQKPATSRGIPANINQASGEDKVLVTDSIPQFAAKATLASIEGDYVEKPKKVFDKEIAKYILDRDKFKADLANDRGKLALEWSKYNLDKKKFESADKEDFASAATVLNEATSIINNGEKALVDVGGGKTETVLRIGDPTLLATFGNVDKDGKTTNVPDVLQYNKAKNQVELLYYDKSPDGKINKTASGKSVIEKSISLDQRTWLKHIAKRSFPNKDIGKVNTLVDEILNKNDNSLSKISEKNKTAPPAAKYSAKMADGSIITSPDGTTWYDKNGKEVK